MNLLVTGGAGFIGSNFVHHILNKYDDYKVVNLDLLTYAGTMSNLEDIKENPNHVFVEGNICDYDLVKKLVTDHKIDTIVNFAAESHVDRSIINPGIFIETNVQGTLNLLNVAKELNVA
ncbi:NAD-dependent epimerase/dehydratase family protein, partial [Listeria monocytogenes]|nr:NAD-dependent epimerase/dehydratase family protein [Listeria monocytogenes]EFO5786031.1 NAD-dependent epimerase/dehydratase family protein [Listeria monocytogenes]